jgi:hypothetical protein
MYTQQQECHSAHNAIVRTSTYVFYFNYLPAFYKGLALNKNKVLHSTAVTRYRRSIVLKVKTISRDCNIL